MALPPRAKIVKVEGYRVCGLIESTPVRAYAYALNEMSKTTGTGTEISWNAALNLLTNLDQYEEFRQHHEEYLLNDIKG